MKILKRMLFVIASAVNVNLLFSEYRKPKVFENRVLRRISD
jgi:hypothetical protein